MNEHKIQRKLFSQTVQGKDKMHWSERNGWRGCLSHLSEGATNENASHHLVQLKYTICSLSCYLSNYRISVTRSANIASFNTQW